MTTNTKYEMIPDAATGLYRIKALQKLPGVEVGDLGGLIASEKSLQVSGNAWVYGKAQVYGDARVFGDAQVSDNARVYGNAQVSDDAQVFGNAQVSGNAWVSDDAWVYGDARVSGNAQVSDDAQVFGNAQVFGDAQVSDDAWVYGDARVSGNAWVSGNAQVSDNARVSGNAWVYGKAQVYGNAWVSDDAVQHGIWPNTLSKAGEILASMNAVLTPAGYYTFYKKVWATPNPRVFRSNYDPKFHYTLGEFVEVPDADPNKTQCSSGIHVTNSLFFDFSGDTWLALKVHIDDILFWSAADKLRCRRAEVLHVVDMSQFTVKESV